MRRSDSMFLSRAAWATPKSIRGGFKPSRRNSSPIDRRHLEETSCQPPGGVYFCDFQPAENPVARNENLPIKLFPLLSIFAASLRPRERKNNALAAYKKHVEVHGC